MEIGLVNAQTTSTVEIGLEKDAIYLYNTQHFGFDENGEKYQLLTKWNKVIVHQIDQSDNKQNINVTWSLFEAIDVERVDLTDDSFHATNIQNYTSKIYNDKLSSKYQILFNEQQTSLAEVPEDMLLNGPFILFYQNELGYYRKNVAKYSENNTIEAESLTSTIKDAKSRIIEAQLDGDANIKLNGTYPGVENAWYNITFDLKLYLVYGLQSNILLSYNINWSITDWIYNESSGEHYMNDQRKLMYWNIREPTSLTEEYPITELFNIDSYNPFIIGFVFLVIVPLELKLISKKRKISTKQKRREN
jgi:hypothetical protein